MTDYRITVFYGDENADKSRRFTTEQSARTEYSRQIVEWSSVPSHLITLVEVNWQTGEGRLVASAEQNWPYRGGDSG